MIAPIARATSGMEAFMWSSFRTVRKSGNYETYRNVGDVYLLALFVAVATVDRAPVIE
jgi:hypothetical protein